jgi:hypothetical protein
MNTNTDSQHIKTFQLLKLVIIVSFILLVATIVVISDEVSPIEKSNTAAEASTINNVVVEKSSCEIAKTTSTAIKTSKNIETAVPIEDSETTTRIIQTTTEYEPVLTTTATKAREEIQTSNVAEDELEILAKLLYCEAGSMGWEGQVYVCSAILNLSDRSGRSIWNMAHDINTFAVAPWVDTRTATSTQYEVINYVLNGGRIKEICYFREDYYHSFGTPVCQIENICFSKP